MTLAQTVIVSPGTIIARCWTFNFQGQPSAGYQSGPRGVEKRPRILDVLQNYTPYSIAFKLAHDGKEMDDREVERSAAMKRIMGWVRLHPYNISQKVQIVVEQHWQPWSDLLSCLKTGQPAFDHVFGMSVCEWRSRHKEQGALFESYLTGETFDQAGPIVEVFASASSAASVAEIGGGGMLAALLIAYPRLDGALFDRFFVCAVCAPTRAEFLTGRYHSRGGAEGVGQATTHAVVSASILILLSNYMLTAAFFGK